MWTASETAGARTLYRVYLALLDGVAPPESFNKSLAVYIPQELDETVPVSSLRQGTAAHHAFQHCAQVARADAESTLDRVAELRVHPAQRGFMPGRGMLENVFEGLAPMHVVPCTVGSLPAVVLFDIKAAFPSVSWQWIWRVLRAISAPPRLIVAVRLIYEGSYSEIVFGRELTDYGFPVRRGSLQGCPVSGSLLAILFDPVVRALAAAHPEPMGSLTAFVDDLAATSL